MFPLVNLISIFFLPLLHAAKNRQLVVKFLTEVSVDPVLQSIPIIQNSTMEQAEEVVEDKIRRFRYQMRMYPVSHLNSGTLDKHDAEIEKRETMLEDLLGSIENYIKRFSSQLSQERTNKLKRQIPALEQDFLAYNECFL